MAEKDTGKRPQKRTLLDTSALIDGKRGITTIFSIIEFPIALDECLVLYPDTFDFELAVRIAAELRKKGRPIGGIDTLIASMSLNRCYILLTKDADFKIIKEVIPEFQYTIL